MRKQTNIQPGDKFNRLTAVEYLYTGKHKRRYFRFRCDCGGETEVTAETVISGNTKSCGCLVREARQKQKLQRLPNDGGVVNQIILQYKRHACDRGIKFKLSVDDVQGIVRQPCHYCGEVAGNIKRTKSCREGFRHNGIDRVDPSKHYTPDNVVPCCKICNLAKRDMTYGEFLEWLKRVATHYRRMKKRVKN